MFFIGVVYYSIGHDNKTHHVISLTVQTLREMFSSSSAQTPVCSLIGPAGSQHPVQALLERSQRVRGCAAREHGKKETHVVVLERATNSSRNKVQMKTVSSV